MKIFFTWRWTQEKEITGDVTLHVAYCGSSAKRRERERERGRERDEDESARETEQWNEGGRGPNVQTRG